MRKKEGDTLQSFVPQGNILIMLFLVQMDEGAEEDSFKMLETQSLEVPFKSVGSRGNFLLSPPRISKSSGQRS